MSQHGYLIFYTSQRPAEPRDTFLNLLHALAIKKIYAAWRTCESECGWDTLQQNLRATGDEYYRQKIEVIDVRDLPPEKIADLLAEPKYLRIDVQPPKTVAGTRVRTAIEAGVPKEVRGDFAPGGLYLGVGYRDIFESSEHDDGLYIARAFFSVEFFGYSTPRNWKEMRRLTFQLPEIIAVKRELEEILGPLEQCMLWDI